MTHPGNPKCRWCGQEARIDHACGLAQPTARRMPRFQAEAMPVKRPSGPAAPAARESEIHALREEVARLKRELAAAHLELDAHRNGTVTPTVTRNAQTVTESVTRNTRNAERQRRYRERKAAKA